MQKIPVVAIFDVGKTNKKLFLFDENYKIVYEKSARFIETVDEDGETCENLESLRLSVFDSLRDVFRRQEFEVKAINFSTYGASFVYIDEEGKPLCPLYNYLKAYPEELKKQFYDTYGGEEKFSKETASPVLGSLNSGMQLYRLKYEKPELFKKIKYALHLPQYLSYLISGEVYSDITSIGCHTNLWDFTKGEYHEWVKQEGVQEKLAPLAPSDSVVPAAFPGNSYAVGVGLHDSSAALIPYLVNFHEPFVLISTGTWCISLNPFNTTPLTEAELQKDCLCYMQYKGKPVKASRFFGGYEHEQQVKRIAAHFNQSAARYKSVPFDPEIISRLQREDELVSDAAPKKDQLQESRFAQRDLSSFASDVEAYHQFILDLVTQQVASTQLVLKGSDVKRIFVDGGFSKNAIYMNLLASFYPEKEVFAASMAQATAIGTALAIHRHWNRKPLPNDIIELKYYAVTHDANI
ncbi:sugar (pentulose or hexulose) kinase [Pontibacter ummariensis]|uniref:Sugar (Pentulose or hexulose) kinase n=1 Tax=Pontibacter ummariensis TaxID=1610492 RepID=A0A239LTX9_9BACT|nr:FGGY family carbohydrate kinase [Pontibacter ummariensis]PRY01201.1 sugar (pentulose or hexulose) kinase [Pontibacter ummariensis]SNT33835.1 Sugar (pentulose or hexulose) kinase [Pontibacter ummariensis]